jgi:hypothetical protein
MQTFLKSFVKHGFILCPAVSGFLRISSKAVLAFSIGRPRLAVTLNIAVMGVTHRSSYVALSGLGVGVNGETFQWNVSTPIRWAFNNSGPWLETALNNFEPF